MYLAGLTQHAVVIHTYLSMVKSGKVLNKIFRHEMEHLIDNSCNIKSSMYKILINFNFQGIMVEFSFHILNIREKYW
jgi:hypothetical protein